MKFLLSLLALTFLFGCNSRDPSIKALYTDYKAADKISKKQNEQALPLYYQILESESDLASVHSNLGVLFVDEKKPDEALKSLELALKLATEARDEKAQFAIRFNLGAYYGGPKKIPEALENYQAALELKPDSKETKHNIELLMQNESGGQSGDKQDDKGEGGGEGKDKKDSEGKDGEDKEKKDDPKEGEKEKKAEDYKQNTKYKPRSFKGSELSEGDVKKILGELKNQEQRIRANFEKKERKDNKNDKDW